MLPTFLDPPRLPKTFPDFLRPSITLQTSSLNWGKMANVNAMLSLILNLTAVAQSFAGCP